MSSYQSVAETIATIGIDLGKNTFHLIGMDVHGRILLHRKVSRRQLQSCLANLPVCLIGTESAGSAPSAKPPNDLHEGGVT